MTPKFKFEHADAGDAELERLLAQALRAEAAPAGLAERIEAATVFKLKGAAQAWSAGAGRYLRGWMVSAAAAVLIVGATVGLYLQGGTPASSTVAVWNPANDQGLAGMETKMDGTLDRELALLDLDISQLATATDSWEVRGESTWNLGSHPDADLEESGDWNVF
ncbi:MAG: hypothetical protein IT443_01460 [Phycisphaeraceae bacterium]|nr:hypothetical protein [Phycisphaeraceae bacterium]